MTTERKVLNATEFQKLGVIGVLIFLINLLMGQLDGDSKKHDDDISKLLVSQSVVEQRLELMTTELERLTKLSDLRYRSTDAEKDLGVLQRQIDSMTKELDRRTTWMDTIESRISALE